MIGLIVLSKCDQWSTGEKKTKAVTPFEFNSAGRFSIGGEVRVDVEHDLRQKYQAIWMFKQ